MKILGIETSCDDTGIAVLEATSGSPAPFDQKVRDTNLNFRILSNVVASQIDVHQEYGGVYPSLAKREHTKNLPIVLKKALSEAGISNSRLRSIDTIAVTYGPGLSPCLWTGITFAKDLAHKWGVPLTPVDHIEGHFLVALLSDEKSQIPISKSQTNSKLQIQNSKQLFPAIGLIVSGGHTQLVHVKDIGKYEIIGETRDDAAGEAFDKTARILGLNYPGGPEIAAQAAQYKIQDTKFKIQLPRPMMHTKNYDFSFSGLKTAVLYDFQSRSPEIRESKAYIQEMAHEIQQAIVDVLVAKTARAAKEYNAKSVILGGGVAANNELRKQLSVKCLVSNVGCQLLAPPKNLSTDNGAMIALAGYFKYKQGKIAKNLDKLEANPNLRIA